MRSRMRWIAAARLRAGGGRRLLGMGLLWLLIARFRVVRLRIIVRVVHG
jgi:hypothetical protein